MDDEKVIDATQAFRCKEPTRDDPQYSMDFLIEKIKDDPRFPSQFVKCIGWLAWRLRWHAERIEVTYATHVPHCASIKGPFDESDPTPKCHCAGSYIQMKVFRWEEDKNDKVRIQVIFPIGKKRGTREDWGFTAYIRFIGRNERVVKELLTDVKIIDNTREYVMVSAAHFVRLWSCLRNIMKYISRMMDFSTLDIEPLQIENDTEEDDVKKVCTVSNPTPIENDVK